MDDFEMFSANQPHKEDRVFDFDETASNVPTHARDKSEDDKED